jgi:hypothetical protein
MSKKNRRYAAKNPSRREFIRYAGLLIGGATAESLGLISSCSYLREGTSLTTTTPEIPQTTTTTTTTKEIQAMTAILPTTEVAMDVLMRIADAHALERWGENIGRGEPVAIYDADGLFAYIFPYIRGARQCPSHDYLFNQIRDLRKCFNIDIDENAEIDAYYSALRELGNNYGAICMSTGYARPPILWISDFLEPYFILYESARYEAERQLAGSKLSKFYYYSPEEQYVEFSAGAKTVLIDAAITRKSVSREIITQKTIAPIPEAIVSENRKSWDRMTAVASVMLTSEKWAYLPNWQLMPMVDHTTKNWCVPSSWAMVLGYYDNYVGSMAIGTIKGYGRFIDYWYQMTPGGYNLPNLIDDLLSPSGVWNINKYSGVESKFPSTTYSIDFIWSVITQEIDAGRPCFFNIVGHTTAVLGYHIDATGERFAITYTPDNPSTPTYKVEFPMSVCIGVSKLVISGGTDDEALAFTYPDGGQTLYTNSPQPIYWQVWGSAISKTRLSLSEDGGNNWQTVADVATSVGINGYAFIPGAKGSKVRFRADGLSATGELIAADGSFKNNEVKLSASGSAWKQIWGPTSEVYASSASGGASTVIYAVPVAGDGIYQYNGTPMNWTKIGGPGKMFALSEPDGALYGLSPDGKGIYRYNGTPMDWTQIGGAATAIYVWQSFVYYTDEQTGDIYEIVPTLPQATKIIRKIGGPGAMFAIDSQGRLYGVSPDYKGIYRYDGTPNTWTRILDLSSSDVEFPRKVIGIYAKGGALYSAYGISDGIYCYGLMPNSWFKVGGPGKMFALDGNGRLYGLSPDGSGVYRYDGSWKELQKWTRVGDAAGKIFAGGNWRLFATNPQTGDLMSYE